MGKDDYGVQTLAIIAALPSLAISIPLRCSAEENQSYEKHLYEREDD